MKSWIHALVAIATSALVAACGGGGGRTDGGTESPPDAAAPPAANLSQALATSGQTKTMAAAVSAAGLDPAVSGSESFTLLMPSDEAMAPFAQELAELSQPENQAALQNYVRAHMVQGKLLAEALAQGRSSGAAAEGSKGGTVNAAGSAATNATVTVRNLLGDEIEIVVAGGTVTVNGASFAIKDLVAGNGVLHVLDAPLFRPSIFGIVRVLPETSTLEAALRAAGLTDALRGSGPLTLFAPTNAAFDKLLRELGLTAEQLLGNKPLLTQVLTYHVLGSQVLARQIEDGATPATLQGQAVTLGVKRDGFGQRAIELTDARGRTANAIVTNLRARNGVVHLIDRVILPTDQDIVDIAAGNNDFSTLVAAVQAAGLVDTLKSPGPFTVFAPTNAAFASLLAELGVTAPQLLADKPLLTTVLTYHVLPGRVLANDIRDGAQPTTVQGQTFTLNKKSEGLSITDARGRRSNIVATNVQASNGVVHVIDKVLLPKAAEPPPPPPPAPGTIVQVAQSLPDFSILVEAVVAAGLVDVLSGAGPFTVFAPTDAAFAALLHELHITKAQLLADKVLLGKVLTYHVVPGRVLAKDVADGATPTTVLGETFTLRRVGGSLGIVDARHRAANVTAVDTQARNGVIHTIDRVILPKL